MVAVRGTGQMAEYSFVLELFVTFSFQEKK